MKTLIPRLLAALLTLLTLTPLVRGEGRVVREFGATDFVTAFKFSKPLADAVPAEGVWRIKSEIGSATVEAVAASADGPRTVTVLTLDNPGITQTRYFLLGDVAYDRVDDKAYLEMWSDFPDGGHYFSRTMGDSGPMMAIRGTSAKRPFMLPFTSNAGQVPSKLTLNVVMPGKGKVTLSRVRLVENGEPATTTQAAAEPVGLSPLSAAGLPPEAAAEVRKQLAGELVAWLRARNDVRQKLDEERRQLGANHAHVLKGEQSLKTLDRRIDALKSAMAEPLPITQSTPPPPPTGRLAWLDRNSAFVFAGLVAVMLLAIVPLRMMMKSGRGRAVVLGFFGLMFVCGVGQLFAAGVALGMGRPADAWVTLLGGAAILIVCGGVALRQARAHYAGFELRKLRAMDVG